MSTPRLPSTFWLVVATSTLLLADALIAQTTLDQVYDNNKQVKVTGMLIGSATPQPPYSVYLLISTRDAKGNVVQWAVEGDSIAELHKRGHRDDSLTMGETMTVVGYPAKPGLHPEERMPKPIRGAIERAFDLAKQGRLIYGTEIIRSDGTKVPFGAMLK
jgi:Family of unknown function (DUF6152)